MRRSIALLLVAAPAVALPAPSSGGAVPAGPAAETAFLTRVDRFWAWFEDHDERLHRNMFDPRIVELGDALGAEIRDVAPGVSWRFGPGDGPGEHALVLSPNGDRDLRVLCEVWIERAPRIEGWVFRPSDPPADLDESAFGVEDRMLSPSDARLSLRFDDAAERVHVGLHHPIFERLEPDSRTALADELVRSALGEDRAILWLGDVTALEAAPTGEGTWTLGLLQTDLGAIAEERGWRAGFELDAWREYSVEPDPDGLFARAAITGGRSSVPWMMIEHHERSGRPRDPLRGTGACYVTVRFPRTALADAVTPADLPGALRPHLPTARLIGVAESPDEVFVDLLALDLERTEADLRHTLAAFEIASEATLLRLARGGPRPVELR